MAAKINFAGDIALFKKYEKEGIDPFKIIELPSADYCIGNFEFIQPADDTEKSFFAADDAYRCSHAFFKGLELSIFDAYGLANNHAMDYGEQGVRDVVSVFEEKGIEWFGASRVGEDKPLRIILNDISFVVIGVATKGRWSKEINGFGPEGLDASRLEKLIEQEQKNCDHIVLFIHWGSELVDIPAPENLKLAKYFIDLGVSAVIGHHPHVPQGIQEYKDCVIAHSLGSFIYIPREEKGYEPGVEGRDISIVYTVEFSKESVLSAKPTYYQYNKESMLPEKISDRSPYIDGINQNVENAKLYTKKLRSQLVKRELKLFFVRFNDQPVRTLRHYFNYIGIKQLRKLLGI